MRAPSDVGRGFACDNCGSVGAFIVKDARWSTTSPPALEVASTCGTGATTPLSLQEARRCGFDDPK